MNSLSDFFSRINCGSVLRRKTIIVPNSRIVVSLLQLLFVKGLISNYYISKFNKKYMIIDLKYHKGMPLIRRIYQISKSSRKVYKPCSLIQKKFKGLFFVSNGKGIFLYNSYDQKSLQQMRGEILGQLII